MLTRWRAPQNGRTPLYAAAAAGHKHVVNALVKADADKNFVDKVRERKGGDHGSKNCQLDEG